MTSALDLVEHATRLWRRRRAASRLGFGFTRASSFAMPRAIRLNGQDVALEVPNENGERVAFVELLLDDCYELRHLARRDIKTIIDIGANVGMFGLAVRGVFPKAVIHAYEPNPALGPALAHHAQAAGIQYFLEAVGREPGFVSLDVNPRDSVLTRSRRDPHGPIPQVSFHQVLERIGGHVDLVKMDCEGAEWAILQDRETWKQVDCLTMEYHLFAGQDHEAIISVIKEIGFTILSQRPASNFGLIVAER